MELRPHQIEPARRIAEFLSNPYQEGGWECLVAATSFGKTLTTCKAMDAVMALDRQVPQHSVWICVAQGELVIDWFDTLRAVGFARRDIGVVWMDRPPARGDGKEALPASVNMAQPVQIVMIQTLQSRLKKEDFEPDFWPTHVILDEADIMLGYEAVHKMMEKAGNPPCLGLTGTPTLHPMKPRPFWSYFPTDKWITTLPASELIERQMWKDLRFATIPPELQQRIASGLSKVQVDPLTGDLATPGQRQVFIKEFDSIYDTVMSVLAHTQSVAWVCADVSMGKEVEKLLRGKGHEVLGIYGETKDRNKRFSAVRQREVLHVVACGLLSRGVNVQCLSGVVMLASYKNAATSHQLVGRAVRLDPNNPSNMTAWVFDFPNNFGRCAPPQTMDWSEFAQSGGSGFYDMASSVCAQCGTHHKRPHPVHPVDRRIAYRAGLLAFADETPVYPTLPLTCRGCGAGYTVNIPLLQRFAEWNSMPPEEKAMLPFGGTSKGWAIGQPCEGSSQQLTLGLLYNAGILRQAGDANRDRKAADPDSRSEAYLKECAEQHRRLSSLSKMNIKLEKLSPDARKVPQTLTISDLQRHANNNPAQALRLMILLAYVKDLSLLNLGYFVKRLTDNEVQTNVAMAIDRIHNGDPGVALLLRDWFDGQIADITNNNRGATKDQEFAISILSRTLRNLEKGCAVPA